MHKICILFGWKSWLSSPFSPGALARSDPAVLTDPVQWEELWNLDPKSKAGLVQVLWFLSLPCWSWQIKRITHAPLIYTDELVCDPPWSSFQNPLAPGGGRNFSNHQLWHWSFRKINQLNWDLLWNQWCSAATNFIWNSPVLMHLKYWSFLVCFAAPALFWHCEHKGSSLQSQDEQAKPFNPENKLIIQNACWAGCSNWIDWGKEKKRKETHCGRKKIRLFQSMGKEHAEETSWCLKGANLPSSTHNFLLYYCIIVVLLGFLVMCSTWDWERALRAVVVLRIG